MLVRKLDDCPAFISGDKAVLRELLHADKGDFGFGYSLAHATVGAGRRTRLHSLKNSEVYYIIAGRGRMHVDGESSEVSEGSVVYVPPRAGQYIENTGGSDLVFLCIVDPAWQARDEQIME